jgi:hypothetical protein
MMVKEKLPVNEPFVVKKLNSVQNLKSGKCLIQFFSGLLYMFKIKGYSKRTKIKTKIIKN